VQEESKSEKDTPKYFRTVVRYEVISEGVPFSGSLEELARQTSNGEMVGSFLEPEVQELSAVGCEAALQASGSNASFFGSLQDRREGIFDLLDSCGVEIKEDGDQPGLWVWIGPTDGCESSFESEVEAVDSAWQEVCRQVMRAKAILESDWDLIGFEEQRSHIKEIMLRD
jgi:hypothetical protein